MKPYYIKFNGYCPECMLKGQEVEMRLNSMDFWECEKTRLQLVTHPPFAAIIPWRGEGKFRQEIEVVSAEYTNLILVRTNYKDGHDTLPDVNEVLEDSWDLDEFIQGISESYKSYDSERFKESDSELTEQEKILSKIKGDQFQELLQLFELGKHDRNSEAFLDFIQKLYDLNLVFVFKWMTWYEGHKLLKDANTDYSQLSLLQLSMLLTVIVRSDRFDEYSLKYYLENGNLEKIIKKLQV